MRQIKNFMEAKRPMWNCNECKCITMQCWKESEAFCGCGDNGGGGGSLQPGNKTYVSGDPSNMHIKLFATTPDGEDYIDINTGGSPFITSGIFNSEGGEALLEVLTSSYEHEQTSTIRTMPFLLGKGGVFPSSGMEGIIDGSVMSLVEKVFNAPTEANKQALMDAIDNAIDAIGGGDLNASFVTYNTTGSVITIAAHQSTIPMGNEEQIATVAVSPDSETITVTSSDTAILSVRAELIPDVPLHAYAIYGEGLSTGTVTVTITGINDPTASASFSIDVLR